MSTRPFDRDQLRTPSAFAGRRRWLRFSLGTAAAGVASSSPAVMASRAWDQRIFQGFGTTLWLRAAHPDRPVLAAALDAAVARVRQIHVQMNLFDSDSALSRLNRDGVLRNPPADLVEVLSLARQISARSDGAFDVTVQPLWQCWDGARRANRLPAPAEIRRAVALVDWKGIVVARSRIALQRPGMAVTLNGIAQGYAAECARAVLSDAGIRIALLDTGEWAAIGAPPGEPGWRLGIENPLQPDAVLARLTTDERFVAASSDAHDRFTTDGRHHHILDPRTGWSPADIASVVVAHPSGALADAMTKVLFTLPAEQGLAVATRWGGDALIVAKSGQWRATAGLLVRPG